MDRLMLKTCEAPAHRLDGVRAVPPAGRRVVYLALVLGLLLLGMGLVRAEEPTPASDATRFETHEITGRLSVVGKRWVSVEYDNKGAESFEMLLPINKDTKVSRVKSLSDLRPRDIVQVQYCETYRKGADGYDSLAKTVATEIMLVKSATNQLGARESMP